MTDTIEIAGREWPVRFTMGALSRFEKRTKVNAFALSDPSKLSSDAAAFLVFCGIAAGCKAEDVEFDVDFKDLMEDMTLAHVIAAFGILTSDVPGEKKDEPTE